MTSQDLKKYRLPNSSGVYLFKRRKQILYIGRATSLKSRVKSYFAADLAERRGPLIAGMLDQADKVDFITTDTVLEAIILEANLIKTFQPKYNSDEKDDKSFSYVVITKEKFSKVLLTRGRELREDWTQKFSHSFGPFTNSGQLKEALKIVRRIFPYRDKCSPGQGRPCFNRQIGLCPGVCTGEISQNDYTKTIQHIVAFFSGKKKEIVCRLGKEMREFAKKQEFEKAAIARKTIFALNHIRDVSLLKRENVRWGAESGYRIEAYDVAHLAGKERVGVMVVVENGAPKKSDYRKFKIRQWFKGDDTGALAEILTRRFAHSEWPRPDLIVVDGGLAQLNTARRILQSKKLSIVVASVVKDEKHRPNRLLGKTEIIKQNKDNILLANSESHRFAVAYHRQKRENIL